MPKYRLGVSGNPSGRPKGAFNKHTQLAQLMEEHTEALVSKTIEHALSGDTIALRLCIERLNPKITDKITTVVMPDLSFINTSKIIPKLLQSLAGQELSIPELKSLMDLLNERDSNIEVKNKKY